MNTSYIIKFTHFNEDEVMYEDRYIGPFATRQDAAEYAEEMLEETKEEYQIIAVRAPIA